MAKAFQFSLQKVLDVREQLEELLSVDLRKRQSTLMKVQQVMHDLNRQKQAALQNPEEKETTSVTLLQLSGEYIQQLNDLIEKQSQIVHQTEKQVEEDRSRLMKATQEKKIVEKLKEKHFKIYRKDRKKKATFMEGEVAQRIVRNKINEETVL